MATLEQRVEYLLRGKERCLIEVALIFARMRESWLTQSEMIDLIGRKYAPSTIRKAFKDLSAPMESLGDHSYIDIESINTNCRGRPILRGKLNKVASERILGLMTPKALPPRSDLPKSCLIGLNRIGRIEIPPMIIRKEDEWGNKQRLCFPPSEMVDLVKQKIGEYATNRLLIKLIKEDYAAKCDKITKTRSWGRPPNHQFRITDLGLEKFLADQNPAYYKMSSILIVDPHANQHRPDDERIRTANELAMCGKPEGIDQN